MSHPNKAQQSLVELARSRGIKEAECFDPFSPWSMPYGVSAIEAKEAGIPYAPHPTRSPRPHEAILFNAGGYPCLMG